MRNYNDYIATARRYLKNYNILKISAENMTEEVEMINRELEANAELPSMIANYSAEPGGGSSELNGVEMATWKRMELERKKVMLESEIHRVTALLRRIDRALSELTKKERILALGFYINNENWDELGEKMGYSERWARSKGGEALKSIAVMLFGIKADPRQQRFVFIE